jgi:hypothetical protein
MAFEDFPKQHFEPNGADSLVLARDGSLPRCYFSRARAERFLLERYATCAVPWLTPEVPVTAGHSSSVFRLRMPPPRLFQSQLPSRSHLQLAKRTAITPWCEVNCCHRALIGLA